MSGYKRVNFYELCRLCATNQQKEKTHIFQEEGRKIQLQTKIQSCLSLTVCENDFLPKVVCSKCLRSLEVCYTFRQECVGSETMLSTYFRNFRETDDFKKSGKVYIKDTIARQANDAPGQPTADPKSFEFPLFSLQIDDKVKMEEHDPSKVSHTYSPTKQDALSNVVVNANGEVINIAQLVDLEAIIGRQKSQKVRKTDENLQPVKIDSYVNLASPQPQLQANKKQMQQAIKRDEQKTNQSVIFNNLDYQQQQPINPNFTYNVYNSSAVTTTTTGANNLLNRVVSSSLLLESNSTTTVNLNQLNQDLQQQFGGIKVESGTGLSKSHICDICQKSFKRREHLYQHVKLHTGFRPYSCENCNKSFMRKEHLLRHQTSHSGQKNFMCGICEKSFSRNDNLLKHKKIHEKQTSYTCEVCQKQFVMKHYYMAHKLTHGGGGADGGANVWNVLKT